MGKAGGGAGLVTEPVVEVHRTHQVVPDQLHCHRPLQRFVHGQVHGAHPAASKPAIETVAAIEHPRPAHRRQALAVVSAYAGRAVETPAAAVALRQADRRASADGRSISNPKRMRDGAEQIQVFLVVRLLRPPRAQDQQRHGLAARFLADDGNQQLDSARREQRAFVRGQLMPHPRRVAQRQRQGLAQHRQQANHGERRGQRLGHVLRRASGDWREVGRAGRVFENVDELRVQRLVDLRDDHRHDGVEARGVADLFGDVLQQPLRVVALPEEPAVEALQPAFAARARGNQRQRRPACTTTSATAARRAGARCDAAAHRPAAARRAPGSARRTAAAPAHSGRPAGR